MVCVCGCVFVWVRHPKLEYSNVAIKRYIFIPETKRNEAIFLSILSLHLMRISLFSPNENEILRNRNQVKKR